VRLGTGLKAGVNEKLRGFRLLPETPAPMRDTQFCYVLGIEWDVSMTAHRCYQ